MANFNGTLKAIDAMRRRARFDGAQERLDAVLQVIYLVFNEGCSAAAGAEVTRAELTGEAIRLGRLLTEIQPEPEVIGLLALTLLLQANECFSWLTRDVCTEKHTVDV